jgi:hypothetical protein
VEDSNIFWNKKVKIVGRSNNRFEHFLAFKLLHCCQEEPR